MLLKYKKSVLAAILQLFILLQIVDASRVKEIDKKINTHRKELEQVQEQIRSLESEKDRLKREENGLIRGMKRLESEIEQSTRRQVQLNRQVRETKGQINRIAQQIVSYDREGDRWEEEILGDLKNYYVEFVDTQRLQTYPLKKMALRTIISLKYADMKDTDARKNVAMDQENRLLNSKKRLSSLVAQLQEETGKQKQSKLEKSQLYKTTQGKRVLAEQEVQRLQETSESLENLISGLTKKKEKTLAAQREAELLKKSFEKKKGHLAWPVTGVVVSRYGKQSHPDLNIPIINNGIRIKTKPNSMVKSVEGGTVVYASDFRSYGQTVIVDHGGNTYSVYGMLGSIQVKEGEKVTVGKVLGTVVSEDGAFIYFEFRNQGRSEDPLLWLE